ncbi:MAG: poly-gamma-glutamate system protein [Spirochaetales bacterium]|nr:poly-gamma-glutamate system protein [Spirochaetales bacterium]
MKTIIRARYLIAALCVALVFAVATVSIALIRAQRYENTQMNAAVAMKDAEEFIRNRMISKGITAEPDDKDKIMLLGPEFSELTTTPGEIKDKRGCLNPNFAAAIVRYLHQAGLKKGDTIAVGTSGSYPGFLIATLIGATQAGIKVRVIASLGASMHGATRLEFTIFDFLEALKDGGFAEFDLVGISRGGKNDRGGSVAEGLFYEGTAELAGDICIAFSEKTGVPYILCDTIKESIARRLELFGTGIDMFVNVGGATVNNGAALQDVETFPSGLVMHMDDIPQSDVRGLCYEYAAQGLPVLSLLYVEGFANDNGISFNPYPMAEPGEGIVYEVVYDKALIIAGIICTLAVLCLGIADPIIRRRRQK